MGYNVYMQNDIYKNFQTHNIPNITILTYPRSGRHWMFWYIKTNTDLKASFIHHEKKEEATDYYKNLISNPIITIVRHPEECLASINTMEENSQIDQRIREYIDHYEFVLKHADLFFKYEDLRDKTSDIVKVICDMFGGRVLGSNDNFKDYEKWYKETQNPHKLITSKSSNAYGDALAHVRSMDLSRHKDLYASAVSKCIDLS
jgi:hypothetical protein